MLNQALKRFKVDLKKSIEQSSEKIKIVKAIHLPITSINSPEEMNDINIYIDPSKEPIAHAERRLQLIESADPADLISRIEKIEKSECLALISEFTSTSDLIKFLRTRTRLRSTFADDRRSIGMVLRSDQLVGMLLNIQQKFKDRDSLEIIGSILRRKVKIYIYPCFYYSIKNGKTTHGIPIISAFRKDRVSSFDDQDQITLDTLMNALNETISSLVRYMSIQDSILGISRAREDTSDLNDPGCS